MVENLDKNLAYVSAKADDRMGYKPSKRRLRGAFTILMETVGTLPKTPLRKKKLKRCDDQSKSTSIKSLLENN